MNSSAKAKATATARNPASPQPSTEPAQTDAVAMKPYALGHLLVDPVVALREDFGQPVELDLVLKTRVIHLAVSLAAIC